MTTLEVAERLGVSDSSVRKRCQRGTLRCKRVFNPYHPEGAWDINENDLAEYLAKQEEPKCNTLSDVDKGYIAGFLDGEGCFTAFITQVCHKKYWSTKYFIQVLVVEEEPIKWLKEITGIGYVFKRPRHRQNYQNLWGWRANNHTACALVRQVMPYLKIKRRQAEIFLELEKRVVTFKNYRQNRKQHDGMPKEEWIERQKLIDEIHRLNKPTGKIIRKEFSVPEAT